MNKKAQSIDLDPNNPISWVFYIIGLFIVVSIAISILSVVNQVAFDSMCNDVVVERDGYKADAEFWESQYNSLNQSIAECDEKVRLIEKSCNNKIANATEQCEKNLNYYISFFQKRNVNNEDATTKMIDTKKAVLKCGTLQKNSTL